jgi:hypothetical protein
VVLSSPIILYDHPAIAKESAGDLFGATEIDEILALRVLTLTDDEKAERAAPTPAPPPSSTGSTASHLAWLVSTARCARSTTPTTARSVPVVEPGVDGSYDPFTDVLVVGGRTVTAARRFGSTEPALRPQDMFLRG